MTITQIVLSSVTIIGLLVIACFLRAATLQLRAAAAIRRGDSGAADELVRRARRWSWPELLIPKRWR